MSSARNVVLRRLAASDLPAFQAYRQDPAVGRYQGWLPMSDSEAMAFLTEMASAPLFPSGKWCQIGIADPGDGGLIGDIGIFLSENELEAEIGFTLRRESQGQGLATAAVREALALIFEETDVDRVRAITDARNTPSIRLLERIGMRRSETREGMFRGESCVEHVYVVTRHGAAARSDIDGESRE